MKIEKEILSEKNYEGTRLIEIVDPTLSKLKKELDKLQVEANPFLAEMEKITPVLDPFYTKLRALQDEMKKTQEEMAPVKEEYDGWLSKVEKIDQKAQLVKNKMQPIILKLIEKDLGEFDKAMQMKEENGRLFVEVQDELEEKIKQVRAAKAKK